MLEDQKMAEDYRRTAADNYPYSQPLGPPKEWEKTKDSYLPYNIRNYQDRLLNFLKRVQEFGV
jgi:hypothetical protein